MRITHRPTKQRHELRQVINHPNIRDNGRHHLITLYTDRTVHFQTSSRNPFSRLLRTRIFAEARQLFSAFGSTMSVGSVDQKSTGAPPVQMARSRMNPRPANHHISYKLTKPKPSKVRQMSREELLGIGLSVIISFVIAIVIVNIGIYVVPVILRVTSEIIMDFVDSAKATGPDGTVKPPPLLSRFLTVRNDLSCEVFTSTLQNRDPVLFSAESTRHTSAEWVRLSTAVLKEEIHLQHVQPSLEGPSVNKADIVMSYEDFSNGEFSLNTAVDNGNYQVRDRAFLYTVPELQSALQPPVISNATHSAGGKPDAACNAQSLPFKDFEPEALVMARNTETLSGGAFHLHKRSVSVLLEGRKRWVLFPPDQIPPGGFSSFENLYQWRRDVQPTLTLADKCRPVEVFQEAGQALYIPEGWYHATQTLSNFSVSVRYSSREELPGTFYHYLVRGDQKRLSGDYAAAVKLYRLGLAFQRDLNLVVNMGQALERLALYAEAEAAYTEAVERNPREAMHFVRLASLLVSHSSTDSSVALNNLLQRAEAFGLKERVLQLLGDSF